MKLLILGGTRFLGPALVARAQELGWEVTLFNRGKSDPGRFPELETLIGDRQNDVEALKGRRWDAVVDTSGYFPEWMELSCGALAGNVGQYVFVSTISVYGNDFNREVNEDTPVPGLPEGADPKRLTNETYGPLKALCERKAEELLPGQVTVVRPGLIVGPDDDSDRFTYWPLRVLRGGEILAGGDPDAPVDFIDVRDLANFCLRTIVDGHVGVYDANGPGVRTTMQELLHGCKIVLGSDCSFTWGTDAELLELGVGPWMELPLWIPREPPYYRMACERARAVGLEFRPVGDTIRDTAAFFADEPADRPRRAGLDAAKEREVLAKLKELRAKRDE
ncbi:MAG: NAD-dependent epimerase/dehydratase family protein [Planctomycetes bacterium]|nr:NAD-dependent epimerase/dehydratase family protein [Planctomycetota bacterium]